MLGSYENIAHKKYVIYFVCIMFKYVPLFLSEVQKVDENMCELLNVNLAS